MIQQQLPVCISKDAIATFCQRHQIRKLALFGSVLRDDFTPESDVDFLVEFLPEARVGLFELMDMEIELTDLIGHEADLRTAQDLSPHFRQAVIDASVIQYAQD